MKLKNFDYYSSNFNLLVKEKILVALGFLIFLFGSPFIYSQNVNQGRIGSNSNITTSSNTNNISPPNIQTTRVNLEIPFYLDNASTTWELFVNSVNDYDSNDKRRLIITKKYIPSREENQNDLLEGEKISLSDLDKIKSLFYWNYQISVNGIGWKEAEKAKVSFTTIPNPSLIIEDLPLQPSKYLIKATLRQPNGEEETLHDKPYEFKIGQSKTISITIQGFFSKLIEDYGTNQSLLLAIIAGLITILVAVLKEKIKAAINWILDTLGKYGSSKLADRRFTRLYIDVISNQHKYLKLIGSVTPGMHRPRLEEVFVSLRISGFNQDQTHSSETSAEKGAELQPAVSFADAISQYKKMVILGGPGAGKTTTLSHSLLVFSQKKAREKFGIQKDLLPIFIPLRRLSGQGKSILEDLIDKETQILPADLLKDCPAGYFEKRLKQGGCIVLLDGLDEVVDETTHRRVADNINSFVATYPENYFIVTCRIAGWQSLLSGDFKILQTQISVVTRSSVLSSDGIGRSLLRLNIPNFSWKMRIRSKIKKYLKRCGTNIFKKKLSPLLKEYQKHF